MTWVTSHRTSLRRSARTIAALYLVAAVFGQTGLIGHAQGKSTDITIKPISDALGQVDSSRTELVFRLDGLDDEKNEVKEEFAITAIENKEREQSASVIRSGLIAGLFGTEFAALAPESLGTFRMGEENYLVLEGKQPLCVLADASMGNMTEGITPDSFLSELDLFSADTKLTGVLLGKEIIGGIPTNRYALDKATLEWLQGEQTGDQTLGELVSVDLWLAQKGDYLVKMSMTGEGRIDDFLGKNFDGEISVQYQVTDINAGREVKLPGSCAKPIDMEEFAAALAAGQAASQSTARATPAPTAKAPAAAAPTPKASTAVIGGKSVPITLKPMSDSLGELTALRTAITMRLDGQDDKKKTFAGDMEMVIAFNTAKEQNELTMVGTLLQSLAPSNELASMNLNGISMYRIGEDGYMLIKAKTDLCLKVPLGAMQGLDEPLSMLGAEEISKELVRLSDEDKLTGRLIGEEMVNGIATRHYALDPDALAAVAVNPASDAKYEYASGEMWVAKSGDYIVKMSLQGTGSLDSLATGFTGDIAIEYAISDVNNAQFEVILPEQCN